MARNEQLVRQHKVLEILERSRFGRSLEEIRDDLIEELGLTSLHTRTLRRDLEALQSAGIDVDSHATQRGRVWKLGPMARKTVKIPATASELIALSLSRDLLYPLAGTQFWQGIESFWSKIKEELPESVWSHYEKYRQTLFVRGMPSKTYDRHHGMLKTIHRSIMEHRVVAIEYQPPGKDKSRRMIEPYAVVFYQSSLYIIAADQNIAAGEDNRIRHWKLDRFVKAVALDKWFKKPEDFNLEEHLGQSAGIFAASKSKNYRIRVSQKAAPWVLEDPWHPQQEMKVQKDGSIIITLNAAHDLEIIPRVLALGNEAEVLAPIACRRAIAELVQQMSRKYRDVQQ
ncbi:MAG: putative DNA-binding transcriptional regulator YafY, partial [Pirellulaceae bacterium]